MLIPPPGKEYSKERPQKRAEKALLLDLPAKILGIWTSRTLGWGGCSDTLIPCHKGFWLLVNPTFYLSSPGVPSPWVMAHYWATSVWNWAAEAADTHALHVCMPATHMKPSPLLLGCQAGKVEDCYYWLCLPSSSLPGWYYSAPPWLWITKLIYEILKLGFLSIPELEWIHLRASWVLWLRRCRNLGLP